MKVVNNLIKIDNYLNLRQEVIKILKTIYDPEIPVNIWDLGLVYGVDIKDSLAQVVMTLTSPNCPAIDTLPQEIKESIESIDQIDECQVQIVWDPPWTKALMTEEARLELGML